MTCKIVNFNEMADNNDDNDDKSDPKKAALSQAQP